jgi:hypothetical protein
MKTAYMCLTLLVGSFLYGCASSPSKSGSSDPYVFDDSKSVALNVVSAAGIDKGLKDFKVPKDKYRTPSKITSFRTTAALQSYYSSAVPGMSGLETAGVGIALQIFSPTPRSERNSIIAWMPATEADKPVDRLSDILVEAAVKAAEDMGYETNVTLSSAGKKGVVVGLYKEGACAREGNKTEFCWIGFSLPEPSLVSATPDFIGNGKSYFFDPGLSSPATFKFNWLNETVDQLEFLGHMSEHLPKWIYIYAAPKKVNLVGDTLLEVPVVLGEGNLYNFVVPQE